MPEPPIDGGAACADPRRRPVGTTHETHAYCRGYRCRFLSHISFVLSQMLLSLTINFKKSLVS